MYGLIQHLHTVLSVALITNTSMIAATACIIVSGVAENHLLIGMT